MAAVKKMYYFAGWEEEIDFAIFYFFFKIWYFQQKFNDNLTFWCISTAPLKLVLKIQALL